MREPCDPTPSPVVDVTYVRRSPRVPTAAAATVQLTSQCRCVTRPVTVRLAHGRAERAYPLTNSSRSARDGRTGGVGPGLDPGIGDLHRLGPVGGGRPHPVAGTPYTWAYRLASAAVRSSRRARVRFLGLTLSSRCTRHHSTSRRAASSRSNVSPWWRATRSRSAACTRGPGWGRCPDRAPTPGLPAARTTLPAGWPATAGRTPSRTSPSEARRNVPHRRW
jgi:hypothetical protein